jgi:hypothetical protein
MVEVLTPAQTGRLRCLSSFYPPDDRLTPTVPEGRPFQNCCFALEVPSARQSRVDFCSVAECCPVKLLAPPFVTFRLKGSDKTMKKSLFDIRKTHDSIAGKVTNASCLKKGHSSWKHGMNAGSHPVHVERHIVALLPGSQRTNSLEGISDEEIQSALADRFVARAYRLIEKRDNKPFPLHTTFLIFEVPSLSLYLHVGYERVPIRPYVPNPMRCYRCRKFGHTQQRCVSHLAAACGEGRHGEEPCPNPSHCVNCSGAQASADRKCPDFLQEKAIQELGVKDGLSFLDARKKFLANQPTIGTKSFATVVRRPLGIDTLTQTKALVDRGVASVAPRTNIPSRRSPPKLKTSQTPPYRL